MNLTRRKFMVGCSSAIAALAGSRVGGLAFAADTTVRDTLVVIFLRGGMDGLQVVAPVDDRNYIAARPAALRIGEGGDYAGLRLANGYANGDFRLHGNAAPLKELYDSGDLAFIHAAGLTNGTRSHFEAMDFMERGTPDTGNLRSGWLTRHLQGLGGSGTLPAVAASSSLPISLMASSEAVSMTNPAEFNVWGHWKYGEQQNHLLQKMYKGKTPLHQAGAHTLSAIQQLARRIPKDADGNALPYEPEHDVEYPTDYYVEELSRSLQSVAQLMKMEMGLQVATVDFGGWDTHEEQAYTFSALMEGMSRAIHAFYNDVSRYHNRLTVVVQSEFGRRLKANESLGTDHGYGNLMMVLGGNVNGGRMYGRWPGLAVEELDDGADLAITTDYRTVLAEILSNRLANPNIAQVFPNFSGYQGLGIVR